MSRKTTSVGHPMTHPVGVTGTACWAGKKFTNGEWSMPIATILVITKDSLLSKIALVTNRITNAISASSKTKVGLMVASRMRNFITIPMSRRHIVLAANFTT